jgi:hypothetical protein
MSMAINSREVSQLQHVIEEAKKLKLDATQAIYTLSEVNAELKRKQLEEKVVIEEALFIEDVPTGSSSETQPASNPFDVSFGEMSLNTEVDSDSLPSHDTTSRVPLYSAQANNSSAQPLVCFDPTKSSHYYWLSKNEAALASPKSPSLLFQDLFAEGARVIKSKPRRTVTFASGAGGGAAADDDVDQDEFPMTPTHVSQCEFSDVFPDAIDDVNLADVPFVQGNDQAEEEEGINTTNDDGEEVSQSDVYSVEERQKAYMFHTLHSLLNREHEYVMSVMCGELLKRSAAREQSEVKSAMNHVMEELTSQNDPEVVNEMVEVNTQEPTMVPPPPPPPPLSHLTSVASVEQSIGTTAPPQPITALPKPLPKARETDTVSHVVKSKAAAIQDRLTDLSRQDIENGGSGLLGKYKPTGHRMDPQPAQDRGKKTGSSFSV